MGGSAIAADLLLGAYRERLRVPMTVVRDYYLPGWIGESTLVILSSYSGGTEETLTCASPGHRAQRPLRGDHERRQARLVLRAPRACRSSRVPPGLPAPRRPAPHADADRCAARPPWASSRPSGSDLEEARDDARDRDPRARPGRSRGGEPGQAARPRAAGRHPADLGRRADGAGRHRWKGQINENAKLPATASALPELDHNEIVGFAGTPAELPSSRALVMLRDPRQHRQVRAALRPHPRAGRAARRPGALDHRRGADARSPGCSTW